jgi:hypothetical protein
MANPSFTFNILFFVAEILWTELRGTLTEKDIAQYFSIFIQRIS